MKYLFLFLTCCSICEAKALDNQSDNPKILTLYNRLDPKSIPEHLAFYQLYKDTETGKKALEVACGLLSSNSLSGKFLLNSSIVDTFISLVTKQSDQEKTILTKDELQMIAELSAHLPNRKLKGFLAKSEEEVLKLPAEEIDLARSLFLSQFGSDEKSIQKMQSYEAMLDLMALQILAKLPKDANGETNDVKDKVETKIAYMNNLIFDEMGFRFPAHSLYAKDIDVYTFLPAVLDSRRGVCLGVSILYMCLAQRLDLPLEMVTPPGHIYVRYKNGDKVINIETTARGIHIDSEEYLTIDTRSLELRSIKEVIGLAHYNLAATFWHREDYAKTIEAYLKAKKYLENDMQLKELLGFAYILDDKKEEGEKLLEEVKDYLDPHSVSKSLMAEEYLNGYVGLDALKAFFKPVDENRNSILEKKNALQKALKEYPQFSSGVFALAVSWMQLHRQKEALETLERYHQIDPFNPTAEYYLASLHMERYDYNKAWEHLTETEKLLKARDHNPKILKDLRKHLFHLSP